MPHTSCSRSGDEDQVPESLLTRSSTFRRQDVIARPKVARQLFRRPGPDGDTQAELPSTACSRWLEEKSLDPRRRRGGGVDVIAALGAQDDPVGPAAESTAEHLLAVAEAVNVRSVERAHPVLERRPYGRGGGPVVGRAPLVPPNAQMPRGIPDTSTPVMSNGRRLMARSFPFTRPARPAGPAR